MDPSFVVQMLSHSSLSLLPLLKDLNKLVGTDKFSYAAVYETIDGPYLLGRQICDPISENMSVLTVLSVMSADSTQDLMLRSVQQREPTPGRPTNRPSSGLSEQRRSNHNPRATSTLDAIPSPQKTCFTERLVPMDTATGASGSHSPCT